MHPSIIFCRGGVSPPRAARRRPYGRDGIGSQVYNSLIKDINPTVKPGPTNGKYELKP